MNPIYGPLISSLPRRAVGKAILLGLQAWEQRRYVRSCMRTLDQRRPTAGPWCWPRAKGPTPSWKKTSALFRQERDYEIALIVEDAANPAARVIRRVIAAIHSRRAADRRRAGRDQRAEGAQPPRRHGRLGGGDSRLVFVDSDARPRREVAAAGRGEASRGEPGVAGRPAIAG